MPGPKNADNDDFTKIDENGDSEQDDTPTPPPELATPPDIFEPPSRDISMVATYQSRKATDKIKSLLFGCIFCCRPSGSMQTPIEESGTKKKGLKHENG